MIYYFMATYADISSKLSIKYINIKSCDWKKAFTNALSEAFYLMSEELTLIKLEYLTACEEVN